jgi:hypothetical protein
VHLLDQNSDNLLLLAHLKVKTFGSSEKSVGVLTQIRNSMNIERIGGELSEKTPYAWMWQLGSDRNGRQLGDNPTDLWFPQTGLKKITRELCTECVPRLCDVNS